MRTSREIYHWIRWDSRFDPTHFAFGYDDHGGEPKEVALAAFVPDGDIPWHRVLYLRRGTAIVWDRRTGLDRLVASADDRASVRWPSFAKFARLSPVRFRDGAWRPEARDALSEEPPLSILTFNVLDEQHVPDDLRDPRRFEALVESILRADASIVALQEVTGAFARFMAEHEGIRRAYGLSHELGADAAQSVLLLSKLPVRWAASLRFSSQKSAVLVGVEHSCGPLLVAGVHLPSDWARDSRDTRRAYLRALVAALEDARDLPTVIAGDFNEGDDANEPPFDELAAFDDLWKRHGAGPGHTWQPVRNALSARASRSDRSRRLDRVWLRCLDRSLVVREARVHEAEALDPARALYASDHWAVRVELGSSEAALFETMEPDASAALTALIEGPIAARIEAIRREHDESFARWPAHVTLMHPFVARAHRERFEALLRPAIEGVEPGEIEFDGVGHFDNSRERVVFLRVKCPELVRVEAALRREPALARCFVRDEWTPHVTVARGPLGDDRVARLERALEGAFDGARVPLSALHWLCKSSGNAMRPIARYSLGRGAHAQRERAVATVDAAISAMLGEGEGPSVFAIGSHAMGAADDESDLDLLALVPSWCEPSLFFDEAARALSRARGVENVQVIDGATVAIVRCEVEGVSVDLQRAARPARVEPRGPGHYDERELDAIDPDSRRAVLAAVDARVLREVVERAGAEHTFSTLVRRVKRWARARQIAGQAYGWMGGLAYAVLAAWSATQGPSDDEEAAFARLIARLSSWGGESAIALRTVSGSWVRSGRDVLPVLAPASPARNVTRSMTPATRTHFRDEVARAHALIAKGEGERVFDPVERAPKHALTVRVFARDASASSVERARGFAEGRMVRAVMALDERGLRPRPLPACTRASDERVELLIGLRTGASPAAREAAASAFEDGPFAVECDWR
ncbi:MAG: poly(A) polymerase [Polyangiales bacterium]